MKQFNLTGDPWSPVLRRDGRRSEVPLLELFERGGEIVDLAVPPADRVALTRLLLCIVMRSLPTPPEYYADWLELTPELIAKHAAEYLRKWRDAFDLYGDLEDAYDKAESNGDVEVMETLDAFFLWDETPSLVPFSVSE